MNKEEFVKKANEQVKLYENEERSKKEKKIEEQRKIIEEAIKKASEKANEEARRTGKYSKEVEVKELDLNDLLEEVEEVFESEGWSVSENRYGHILLL